MIWDGSDLLFGMAVVGVGPPEPPRTVSGVVWDGSDFFLGRLWLVFGLGDERKEDLLWPMSTLVVTDVCVSG